MKCTVSFLAFVLGLTLTVLAAGFALFYTLNQGPRQMWDNLQSDYQQTHSFRSEVRYYLEGYLERYLNPNMELTAGERDRNVLYEIRDGQELLSSNIREGQDLTSHNVAGYNFYLEYRSGKVSLWKDGKELDVYGDGVFRDTWDQWELPGYDNLDTAAFLNYVGDYPVEGTDTAIATPLPGLAPAAESTAAPAETVTPESQAGRSDPWAGCTIRMAVAETPVYYGGTAAYTGSYYNGMYWQADSLRGAHLALSIVGGALLAGIALLVWSLLWRRWLGMAWAAIGRVTGRIWLEFKLLLLLPLLVYLATTLAQLIFARYLSSNWFFFLPLAVWVLVGYANDFVRNRGRLLRQSFCAWAVGCLRGDGLDLPFQKSLQRESFAALIVSLILAAGAALLDLWLLSYMWRYTSFPALFLPFLLGLLGVVFLVFLVLHWKRQRALAADLGRLSGQIEAVRRGREWTDLPGEQSGLRPLALGLQDIDSGLQEAVEARTRSQRMKVELITNVSHDLKTPLTSILSYAELLSQEELPPQARDYVTILNEKALRLKTMVQEVFEVSKAASGELAMHWEDLDLAKLLRQTLADQAEPIAQSGLTFRTELPRDPVPVRADGDRLYRVFQNLIQNALKYALEGSRVYISLTVREKEAVARVQNTSREELPQGVDFTERFVRGDPSRTDGGSGLGLAIASSFTQACGGELEIVTDADLFTAQVRLPLLQAPAAEETAP